MASQKAQTSDLRTRTRKISLLHYLYMLAVAIQLIAFDAGRLIVPETIMQRWWTIGAMLLVTTIAYYIARNRSGQPSTLKALLWLLIVSDIAFASYNVYTQRGMASRAVALYAIPIIVAAALQRRSALIATAVLSIAAYVITCVSYFTLNFNEGYKLELYSEVGFYSALMLILALGIWIFIRPSRKSS